MFENSTHTIIQIQVPDMESGPNEADKAFGGVKHEVQFTEFLL